MKSTITVNTQAYFGDHFYYSGWIALLLGIPILIINWYVGLICLFIGILVTTSYYKLSIDKENKETMEYLFILGVKRDKELKHYQQLNSISVFSKKYTQQLQLRAASTIIRGTLYSAYLVTESDQIFIGESKQKTRIIRKAKNIAEKLGVEFHSLKE